MDSDTLLGVLEWTVIGVASAYGAILAWAIRRLLAMETNVVLRRSHINERLAVLESQSSEIKSDLDKLEERNKDDHAQILGRVESVDSKIDEHHRTVTTRLDTLLTTVKNGSK